MAHLAFVRALKAPTDGQPAKIEIAAQAWAQGAAQNKAEAIVDFVLTRLLKDRTKPTFADERYWALLLSVLESGVLPRAWLLPLLNRTPLLPLCASLCAHPALLDAPARALAALWPLAAPKFAAEALLDAFGALCALLAQNLPHVPPGLGKLGALLCAALRHAHANSSAAKKLHATFLAHHLQNWAAVAPSSSEVAADVHATGLALLFAPDTLASIASSPSALLAPLPPSAPALSALPRLLSAFAAAARRHRAQLPQGMEVRGAGAGFFSACSAFARTAPTEMALDAHRARLALLEAVEREALAAPGAQEALRDEAALCVAAVSDADEECAGAALQSLGVLERLDHGLLEPHTPALLSSLLAIPPSPAPAAQPASALLSLLLAHHSRARTLPDFVSSLLDALAAPTTPPHTSIRSTLYPRTSASPPLDRTFLAAFARALGTFTTPGQVLPLAQTVLGALDGAHALYTERAAKAAADAGAGPRKKARKSGSKTAPEARETGDVDAAAAAFAHAARLAGAVLPVLPTHTAPTDVQDEVRACMLRADFVREELLARVGGEGRREAGAWGAEVVLAAALRLAGALSATVLDVGGGKRAGLVQVHGRGGELLPELFVELSRYLLATSAPDDPALSGALDATLAFLEAHLSASSWSGRIAELTEAGAAAGLLRLLLGRFVHVVDAAASTAQAGRLVELLFRAGAIPEDAANGDGAGLTPAAVMREALRAADFWEQQRLRPSLLSALSARLAPVAPDTRAREALRVLLSVPAEYLSRAARADALRRAIALDMALMASPSEGDASEWRAVRVFLGRTLVSVGAADHTDADAYLEALVRDIAARGAGDDGTLDILDVHLRTVFRAAQKQASGAATALLALILPLPPAQSAPAADANVDIVRARTMALFAREFAADSFPEELLEVLRDMQARLAGRAGRLLSSDDVADDILRNVAAVEFLATHLRFSAWLGVAQDGPDAASTANTLLTELLAAPAARAHTTFAETCAAVFALHIAELECAHTDKRAEHILRALGAYVVLSAALDAFGALDEQVAKATRGLSVDEYANALDLVGEMLRAAPQSDDVRLAHTARLGSALLRGAPEGTLKVCQTFFARALGALAGCPAHMEAPALRTQILEFLAQQCAERPALLRPTTMHSVWPLLARALSGSPTRDTHASPRTFHTLISILSALARLRRDLLLPALPHLARVLRALLSALRTPRAGLGAAQQSLVARALPAWVDPHAPLGAPEARALARLLTALVAKVPARAGADAVALARPLAKHAPAVLAAYAGAAHAPLAALPASVRGALAPGLFALCGALGAHDRDALMASGLDAPGRAVFKGLWAEYEAQRYVGRG